MRLRRNSLANRFLMNYFRINSAGQVLEAGLLNGQRNSGGALAGPCRQLELENAMPMFEILDGELDALSVQYLSSANVATLVLRRVLIQSADGTPGRIPIEQTRRTSRRKASPW